LDKFLIAGLGNIGEEYKNTRHNIGFQILDRLAEEENLTFAQKKLGFITEFNLKGRKIILLKPTTYMNRSGEAVLYWMKKEDINPQNLLIVVDDIALPFGKIRLRPKGSEGGHNGLISITENLGNNEYPRLRFGIGNNFPKGQQVNYVLGEWNTEEKELLPEKINYAIEAIKCFTIEGIEKAMNKFNK